ncbi:MAG: DUF2207 domain-containing protein, partial [Patescibacteria group bacterium]
MKKIIVGLLLSVIFISFSSVSAQVNDIQPDAVNLNAIYPSESAGEANNNITGEHIKSFDSNIIINKDGTIDVKESIIYDFSTLNKHGIYRDIPFIKTNQDGKKFELKLDNVSVADENGRSYKFVKSWIDEKILRLKIGDADLYVTGEHQYIISYKVFGALTYYSDHDELYWNVTGNEWNVPIAFSRAQVTMPGEIEKEKINLKCFAGGYGSTQSDCRADNVEGMPVFGTNNYLMSNSGLSVVISFPKNIVAVLEPKEFVSFWETWVGKLLSLLLGLLALTWYVGLPFFIIYKWFKSGRDPKGTVGVTSAWFDPPKTQDGKRFLTPGEVGTLGDETVDMKDISASIVDLARRGYLTIDERKKGDFYLIKNKEADKSLLNYEETILTKFFGMKNEIRIKSEKLATDVEQVKNEMYEQVVEDKLFDKNPQTTRTIYYVIAGIALFTGNFFLAIVAFLFGRVMPRKTVYGVEAKNVSFSLKNFLTSQERQLTFQADKQMMFEKLLPFAVAFGV